MKRFCAAIMVMVLAVTITAAAEDLTAQNTEAQNAQLNVGDVICFGAYEQDNDINNGKEPIEWLVLDVKEDGRALLLSRFLLDAMPYDEKGRLAIYDNSYVLPAWRDCSLRAWLNGEFFDAAFNETEKADIVLTYIKDDNNPDEEGVLDSVFLLSKTEAETYLKAETLISCFPTAYALARGAFTENSPYLPPFGRGAGYWYLRTPYNRRLVYSGWASGKIKERAPGNRDDCVRPAIWISTSHFVNPS